MTKNKINTYGYMTLKHNKYHMPIFVIEIYTNMTHGIYFFNNNPDANGLIQKEKASLKKYGIDLQYDSDFDFDVVKDNCIVAIQNSVHPFSKIENRQIYCFL